VLAALAAGGFTLDQRRALAAEAFAHTAAYDIAVASWFASAYAPDETAREAGWPRVAGALWQRADVLRYGENPHQRAALYTRPGAADGIAAAELLHGKAMSYNNYVDADAARRAATTSPSRAWPSSSTPTRAGSPSAPTSPTRTPRRTRATRSRRSAG
jgi:AICAR transformylase/IMP cyclohydrolase PurH (only IMP cyclohydrolase domain in Aful)